MRFSPLCVRCTIAASFVAGGLAPLAAGGQSAGSAVEAGNSARIDSIFAGYAARDTPGCAVGVFRAGEVVFARGYGMASVEHAVPITPATPFNVASLSKQFTAFAVHLLARRGKLSLDDDIRRHLPELPDVGQVVTVRHLMHHTSGLRAYEVLLMLTGWNRDHPLSREQALAVIRRQRTVGFVPGERQQYGNTNYILLAEIVERVAGRPFAEFMADEVFAPLGMTSTHVRTDPLSVIPGRAETYWPRDGGGFRRNHIWAFAHATGASNVITTIQDLARWDANFYHERVGGPGIAETMYRRGPLLSGDSAGYASGLESGVYRGVRSVAHAGGAGGDYFLVRFPDQGLATAVLCNVDGGADAGGKAYLVSEHFLGDALALEQAEAAPADVVLPASALARFAGEYRNTDDPFERLLFEVRRDTLGYGYQGGFYPVVATGPRTFREGPLTFEFTEPVAGTPTRISIARPGWRGTAVQWMEPPWHPTSRDLAAFEGTYRSEELDVAWTVALADGGLVLRRPRFAERALTPGDRDAFRFADSYEDMTLTSHVVFERGADGAVTGFHLTTNRVARLLFTRAGGAP